MSILDRILGRDPESTGGTTAQANLRPAAGYAAGAVSAGQPADAAAVERYRHLLRTVWLRQFWTSRGGFTISRLSWSFPPVYPSASGGACERRKTAQSVNNRGVEGSTGCHARTAFDRVHCRAPTGHPAGRGEPPAWRSL